MTEADREIAVSPWTQRLGRALLVLWVFALVLAISPYTSDPAAPAKWLASSLVCAALALVHLIDSLRHGSASRSSTPHAAALLVFAAVYGSTAALSPWPGVSLHAIAPWINAILVSLLAPRFCRRIEDVDGILKAMVLAVALSSLYGMAQKLGFDPYTWADTSRYEYTGLPSTFGHPNFAGHVLVIGIALSAGLILRTPWTRRHAPTLAALMVGGALMLLHLHYTGMRAGWLALGGAALLSVGVALLRMLMRQRPERLPVTVLGLLLGGAGMGILLLRQALLRFQETRLDIDSSWILRLNGYLGSTEHFVDHRWHGGVPGMFRDIIVPYWTDFERRWFVLYDMRNNHAHNEFLEAAVEAGLPGVAATLLLVLAALHIALSLSADGDSRKRAFGLSAFAALTAFLLDAQFGFNLHTPAAAGLFFLLLGLSGGILTRDLPATPYALRLFTAALSTTLAVCLAALAAISFRAEWQTLRAQGGITWAAQQNALRPDLAEKALRFVTAELTTVCALPFARAEQWDLLAQAQARLDENDAAAASYREAMQRAPYDPKLLARAAAFVLDRFPDADAREEARQLAEAALTLSPDLASANLTLAEVFWERYQEEFTKRPEPRTASLEALLAWRKEQFGLLFARIREHAERAAHFAPEPDTEAWELLDQLSLAERGVAYPQARAELAQVEPWNRARWTALRESVDAAAFGKVLVQAYAEARTQWPPADYLPELALACTEAGAVPGPNLAMDALALRPERWALWGAVLRSNPLGADYVALLEARSEIGPCDEETTRKLAPLFALLDALDTRDIAASIKALEGISGLTSLMYDAGMDHLDEEVGWCARITLIALRAWHLPPEEAAGLLLRIADIASRAGELEFAESLASESAGFLRGVERAGALLLLSEAAVRKGDGSTALALAQQAAALAPYALPVRWNLALRLSEANRRAEADFEFSGLLPQLNPQTRDGREKLEQYEAFRSAAAPEGTP